MEFNEILDLDLDLAFEITRDFRLNNFDHLLKCNYLDLDCSIFEKKRDPYLSTSTIYVLFAFAMLTLMCVCFNLKNY